MAQQYWIRQGPNVQGPFDIERVRGYIEQGRVRPDMELSADGGYRLVEPTRGDTVADVLRYVRYEPAALLAACGEKIATADLDPERRVACLAELEAALANDTYLEPWRG